MPAPAKADFEILEHTADIGLRVRGITLTELFATAALGLESLALDTDEVAPEKAYSIEASGEDLNALLVNWLNEVIYLLDGKHIVLSRFEIDQVNETRIEGIGWGEPRDPERHHARLVVKAATYHQLKVEHQPTGWIAEIFFDI